MPLYFECASCGKQEGVTDRDWKTLARECTDCGVEGCALCMPLPVPRCATCEIALNIELSEDRS